MVHIFNSMNNISIIEVFGKNMTKLCYHVRVLKLNAIKDYRSNIRKNGWGVETHQLSLASIELQSM